MYVLEEIDEKYIRKLKLDLFFMCVYYTRFWIYARQTFNCAQSHRDKLVLGKKEFYPSTCWLHSYVIPCHIFIVSAAICYQSDESWLRPEPASLTSKLIIWSVSIFVFCNTFEVQFAKCPGELMTDSLCVYFHSWNLWIKIVLAVLIVWNIQDTCTHLNASYFHMMVDDKKVGTVKLYDTMWMGVFDAVPQD